MEEEEGRHVQRRRQPRSPAPGSSSPPPQPHDLPVPPSYLPLPEETDRSAVAAPPRALVLRGSHRSFHPILSPMEEEEGRHAQRRRRPRSPAPAPASSSPPPTQPDDLPVPPSSYLPLPEETDRRRRRRPNPPDLHHTLTSPSYSYLVPLAPAADLESEPSYLPPGLEFQLVEAPTKPACIPASKEAMLGLQEVCSAAFGGDDCAICLQSFSSRADHPEKLRAMPCSHAFHENCIFEWLGRNAVCPLCRHALPTTPPSTPDQQPPQQQQRRRVSAYNSDDDEEYLAALGDSVINQDIEVDDEGNAERIRAAEDFVRRWMMENADDDNPPLLNY